MQLQASCRRACPRRCRRHRSPGRRRGAGLRRRRRRPRAV